MTLLLLDYFGTIVFALSGALAAGRREMDFFGALVLATATAIGGGTIRDVLLDLQPFWFSQTIYLYLIFGTCVLVYFSIHFLDRISRKSIEIADALGLSVFTVVGCLKAIDAGMPLTIAVIMGIMTGVAGGLIRDLLCNRIPLVLASRHFYATASFFGALTLVLVLPNSERYTALLIGGSVTLFLRLAAIQWDLKIPLFPNNNQGDD